MEGSLRKETAKVVLRRIRDMMVVAFAILLYLVFWPRSYDVPKMQERGATQYWDLPTGSRIAYVEVKAKGEKPGAPIIFLQGGPGGFISSRLIYLLGRLANEGHDVYLYDQVGSGYSERLEHIAEYTADRHERDLEAIIDGIGAGKVILLGQSWGAMLATLYMADHADRVERLILTGPGPILPVREDLAEMMPPDSLHMQAPPYTNRQANEQAANVRSRMMAVWALWFHAKLASDREADDFQTLLNRGLNRSTVCDSARLPRVEGGGGYYAQLMTVKSFADVQDVRPRLKNCKVPLLVMKGQCDNQAWGYATEYLDLFPDHRLVVVPGAGHSISVEQPDVYINTIRDFLRK